VLKLLSHFGFRFNLRRYILGGAVDGTLGEEDAVAGGITRAVWQVDLATVWR